MNHSTAQVGTSFGFPMIRMAHSVVIAFSLSGRTRADTMINIRSCRMQGPPLAALILMITTCMVCTVPGCASARAAPERKAEVLTREYVAEVLRYLYRWYADETM